MASRADTLTSTTKQLEFFSDFTNAFKQSPFSKQLSILTNEKSVNQSLKNLILTNTGERLFQPNIGSDIRTMLFEPNYLDYLNKIEMLIKNTIAISEPRINLLRIDFPETNDPKVVDISLTYQLINNPEEITYNLILKRVR